MKKVINSLRVRQVPIPGCEDYYVTECGRLWSEKSGKWLGETEKATRQGYIKTVMYTSTGEGRIKMDVHRIVAVTYLGLDWTLGRQMQVDHIDGDKTNNAVSNLRILSAQAHVGLQQKRRSPIVMTIENKYTGQRLRGTSCQLAKHPDISDSRFVLYNLVRGQHIDCTRSGWFLVENHGEKNQNLNHA